MSDLPGPIDEIVRWLLLLAEKLEGAAADSRRAGIGIERCWSDDRGRDWVERLGLVSRQLDRDAAMCADTAGRLARDPVPDQAPHGPGPGPLVGPLLGSTAGRRVDAARGMRIATLSDSESLPPGIH